MPRYLSWSPHDFEIIERALKRYKMWGLEPGIDLDTAADGIVSLSQVDLRKTNAPVIIFEIHKFARSPISDRAYWVVQLRSIDGETQELREHGCVSASSLVFAIAAAEKDAQDGLVSTVSFERAAARAEPYRPE